MTGSGRGQWLALSLGRRVICDLTAAARHLPLVVIARRMPLAALAEARERAQPRIGWCALFVKAFAAVAVRHAELRRAYFSYPWPHLYEHPHSAAMVAVERPFGDAPAVFFARIDAPERQPLHEIEARIRRYKDGPIESIGAYRRTLRVAALPRALRRLLWAAVYHSTGRLRTRYFGTFGVSSIAAQGGRLELLHSPLTATVSYGPLEADGTMDVRLTIDHRVLDGAETARALEEMERVLRCEILSELRYLRDLDAA
jgi:hypothetical protein